MITQLVFSALFMGIALGQTTDGATECQTTCHATNRSSETGNGSWVVHFNKGISYFYLSQLNLVVIVNLKKQLAGVLDGNNGTGMMLDVNNGYGGVANFATNLMYIFSANHTCDLSGLVDKNYSVVANLITIMENYTRKVVGDNINTTQNGYINATDVLRDNACNLDATKWNSTRNITGSIEIYVDYLNPFRNTLYKFFHSGKGTPELGASVFFILLMEMDKQIDAFWMEFFEVTITIIQTLRGKFSRDLMYEYYKIIVNLHALPIHIVIRLLNHLITVIRGVGTIYGNIRLALNDFLWHTRGPFGLK